MVLVTVMCEQEENFGEIINVSRHTFVEAPAFKDSDTMDIDCILRFQYVPQTVAHKNKKKKIVVIVKINFLQKHPSIQSMAVQTTLFHNPIISNLDVWDRKDEELYIFEMSFWVGPHVLRHVFTCTEIRKMNETWITENIPANPDCCFSPLFTLSAVFVSTTILRS